MSAGGSFNPSGGPIDNQQRLQTSPNPSLPPADYSMGYARNFQPPSFFNPFSGYYGANTGMGGFQSQFGGFQQPQFGGFGGFQQPQFGGFQQPFGGGFSQPSFGNPFSRGFNPRTMPPQMQPGMGLQPGIMPPPLPYDPRSEMPTIPGRGTFNQPMPIGGGAFQPGVGNQRIEMGAAQPTTGGSLFSSFTSTQPTTPYSTVNPYANETDEERRIRVNNMTFGPIQSGVGDRSGAPRGTGGITANMSGLGAYTPQPYMGGFNPMMGGGIGAFGDRGFMGYR